MPIASSLNLPLFLDPTRNCPWLMMVIAGVIGIGVDELLRQIHRRMPSWVAPLPATVVVLVGASRG